MGGDRPPVHPAAPRVGAALLVAVAFIAGALISYEVTLMRRLVVERWHHFGFLVISLALLGFGASGTLLAILERPVRRRPETALVIFGCVLLASLAIVPRLAGLLPVTARFIPGDLAHQALAWSGYWLAALVPFLAGGTFLGAALMTSGQRVGRVYGADLIGSGVGAAGTALLVSRLPLAASLWPAELLVFAGLVLLTQRVAGPSRRVVPAFVAVCGTLTVALEIALPAHPTYDEHKYAAQLRQLAAQGTVERVAERHDPHGLVQLYASDLFHDLPFLAPSQPPPPMYSLTINGDPAGSVLRIDSAEQAAALDHTLMALPYELVPKQPRVLLLGETGGANTWLALRHDATAVHAVQPNEAVIALLRRYTPALLEHPAVRFIARDPRSFINETRQSVGSGSDPYDLIQIVSLEGLGLGSAGMQGLAEDHLATVEGFAACLQSLSPGGTVAVTRGIQQPPRESIRIFATLAAALERIGVERPGDHLVQVRDYLGVTTLAFRGSPGSPGRADIEPLIERFNLTPVWYAGLATEDVNRPDALPGPEGSGVDWLHYAAREILSARQRAFFEDWLLDVRPATDNSPFFWDFYKPEAVTALREAHGPLWLTRAELGRLFVYVALATAGAAAVLLILVPLGLFELVRARSGARPERADTMGEPAPATVETRRRVPTADWRTAASTVVYFAAIGLAFMGVEMALISRAIGRLGDPVQATALVIGGVLLLSGAGSAVAGRFTRGRSWLAPVAAGAAALGLSVLGVIDGAGRGTPLLLAVAVPSAFLMGWPMPTGLAALDVRAPRLVPWAWGINGVASVIATSGAILGAMVFGYAEVLLVCAGLYGLAAVAVPRRGMAGGGDTGYHRAF